MSESAKYGWGSSFPDFAKAQAREVQRALQNFVRDASASQVRAWRDSIPPLQREVSEILTSDEAATGYSTILEYELPLELRRPDVVLLVRGPVVVLELKGQYRPSQAAVDQVAAYARDLRCYHRDCATRAVIPVLVPTRARGYVGFESGVHVAGPDHLDQLVSKLSGDHQGPAVDRAAFLSEEAYQPLPKLVEAARELFLSRTVRTIWRARAATDPAVERVAAIIHEAARTRTRRLVLVTGVPGAGKTLVGLRTVHARYLDDLAVARAGGKPTAPAVFLSGNGPLVQVLQYELKKAGGGGKAFVRDVMKYVKDYSSRPDRQPPEHVIVFDEAQRAFDAEQVQAKHQNTPGFEAGHSEPEHIVEFADRIPEWCVVVGLIGTGQEIHVGEEGGLIQWRHAVERSARASEWGVDVPPQAAPVFSDCERPVAVHRSLSLDTALRFHLAEAVHAFVEGLLSGTGTSRDGEALEQQGFHLRLTRDFTTAADYLHERYREDPLARFGLVASSKDRDLVKFGIANDFLSTRRVKYGPWYTDPEDSDLSCRRLDACVTEFGAQGLELDAVLLAWGTDLVRQDGRWNNDRARGYQRKGRVKDPFQLRLNAYRVLLTRGRDACVVFIPPLTELDETHVYLRSLGFKDLDPKETEPAEPTSGLPNLPPITPGGTR